MVISEKVLTVVNVPLTDDVITELKSSNTVIRPSGNACVTQQLAKFIVSVCVCVWSVSL